MSMRVPLKTQRVPPVLEKLGFRTVSPVTVSLPTLKSVTLNNATVGVGMSPPPPPPHAASVSALKVIAKIFIFLPS